LKIAITGANGFLGSHLVRTFLSANFEVIALVRSGAKTTHLPKHKSLFIELIDYSSAVNIEKGLSKIKLTHGDFDYLLHNAGLTVSSKKKEYFLINSNLSQNLLDAIQLTGFLRKNGNFIYISSFAAHGPSGYNEAVSSYGKSKAISEKAISESGLKYLIIRPTAIYGEGDFAFLPLFRSVSKGVYPYLAPKDQKITFVHALDLSKTIFKEKDHKGIIHVSDHQVYSHMDLMKIFQKITHRKIYRLKIPTFLVKAGLTISDTVSRLLGIRPAMTLEKYNELRKDWNLNENANLRQAKIENPISLEEGFEKTLKYYQENHLIK
jgi:nucleoside-diphosphate-sugar epimerase